MQRSVLVSIGLVLSAQAAAHVGSTSGAAHAAEHAWLALAVGPLAWLGVKAVRQLRNRVRRRP